MLLSGVDVMLPAYLSFEISNLQIQISTLSGVSTLVIGVLLIVCGLMTWFMPEGRLLAGVAAIILAVVALPSSNLGGFLLGSLLGIFGGAAALSWAARESRSPAGSAAGDGAESNGTVREDKAAPSIVRGNERVDV